MSEYHHLVGSEEVASAGRNMARAAEAMSQAASTCDEAARRIEQALQNQQVWMEDWLARLEAVFNKKG